MRCTVAASTPWAKSRVVQECRESCNRVGRRLALRRRDAIVGGVATAAGSGLLADAPWQRLMDSVDRGRAVDMATVQLMQDRTADFFETEYTVPARHVLDSLASHRATLTTLLGNARTDATRDPLMVMLGETEALIGWLHFDLGQANDATNAWRATLKIAKDTGDRALAACALGYWSYLASSRNDITPAVRLLRQAEEYVPGNSAPATRSWIAARAAEESARLGEDTAALCSLERAFTAFDFARPRTERVWTATALADDAIDVTVRTETSLARRRLLTLASALATSSDPGATGALREHIVSALRR
jgi:tetratricopeptide (TPR) repeat protein